MTFMAFAIYALLAITTALGAITFDTFSLKGDVANACGCGTLLNGASDSALYKFASCVNDAGISEGCTDNVQVIATAAYTFDQADIEPNKPVTLPYAAMRYNRLEGLVYMMDGIHRPSDLKAKLGQLDLIFANGAINDEIGGFSTVDPDETLESDAKTIDLTFASEAPKADKLYLVYNYTADFSHISPEGAAVSYGVASLLGLAALFAAL